MDQLVSKTIYISLFVQIFTTAVSTDGIFDKLYLEDLILQDILKLELLVQIIETSFYLWVIFALNNIDLMTPRRYIDQSYQRVRYSINGLKKTI